MFPKTSWLKIMRVFFDFDEGQHRHGFILVPSLFHELLIIIMNYLVASNMKGLGILDRLKEYYLA